MHEWFKNQDELVRHKVIGSKDGFGQQLRQEGKAFGPHKNKLLRGEWEMHIKKFNERNYVVNGLSSDREAKYDEIWNFIRRVLRRPFEIEIIGHSLEDYAEETSYMLFNDNDEAICQVTLEVYEDGTVTIDIES